ncbi:hypothetical protein IAR50_002214 [Cryptococcus sp. DSM 104548]
MPLQPPPTPWITDSRFADESLLLEAEPIFDTSIGDESVWGGNATVIGKSASDRNLISDLDLQGEKAEGGDMTFDLGDYLPEEVVAGHGEMSRAQVGPPSLSKLDRGKLQLSVSSITEAALMPKNQKRERESSEPSSLGATSKRARQHCQQSDDLFARDLNHQSKPKSSKPVSQVSADTASARLKTQLKKKQTSDPEKEKNMTTPSATTEPSSSKQSGSALSRYLAKSSVLATKTLVKVEPKTPRSGEPPAFSEACSVEQPIAASVMPPTPPSVPAADLSPASHTAHQGQGSSQPALAAVAVRPFPIEALNSRSPTSISPPAPQARPKDEMCTPKATESLLDIVHSAGTSGVVEGNGERKNSKCDVDVSIVEEVRRRNLPEQARAGGGAESARTDITGPIRRKPIGLTKPVPFSRPLGERPHRAQAQTSSPKPHVDPKKPFAQDKASSRAPLRPATTAASTNVRPGPPKLASKATKPTASSEGKRDLRKPPIPSSFASTAALARRTKPTDGHASVAEPIRVREKDTENARGVFERLASSSVGTTRTSRAPPAPKAPKNISLQPTVPLRGHTPGKSSALRAQQRAVFDQAVKEKIEEQERIAAEEKRRREAEEEEAYKRQRKETVIWAKPVPELYKGGKL